MGDVRNGILESAIKQAVDKLAEKGVDGCTTKDVILASFASLNLDGGVAKSVEIRSMIAEIRLFGWKVFGACSTALIAIIITLIFL